MDCALLVAGLCQLHVEVQVKGAAEQVREDGGELER